MNRTTEDGARRRDIMSSSERELNRLTGRMKKRSSPNTSQAPAQVTSDRCRPVREKPGATPLFLHSPYCRIELRPIMGSKPPDRDEIFHSAGIRPSAVRNTVEH